MTLSDQDLRDIGLGPSIAALALVLWVERNPLPVVLLLLALLFGVLEAII